MDVAVWPPVLALPVGHGVQLEAVPPVEYVFTGHVVQLPLVPVALALPAAYCVLM
jgi:hypothetical protein